MASNKKHEGNAVFQQIISSIFKMALKACAFILWVVLKALGGLFSFLASLLEHYLDL